MDTHLDITFAHFLALPAALGFIPVPYRSRLFSFFVPHPLTFFSVGHFHFLCVGHLVGKFSHYSNPYF